MVDKKAAKRPRFAQCAGAAHPNGKVWHSNTHQFRNPICYKTDKSQDWRKHYEKKIIAVLLSACMLVSACPTGAFAMSDEETNTYTATGDVMQGETSVVEETPAPEETAAPEETPTPAPEETPTPAPAETPAPVEVKAQATPAAGTEETAPAKQSAETGIAMTMLRPDDEKPTVDTYRFYDADDADGRWTEWKQTVAAGDELLEPPAPTKENARFVGWYDESCNLFEGFGKITSVTGVRP